MDDYRDDSGPVVPQNQAPRPPSPPRPRPRLRPHRPAGAPHRRPRPLPLRPADRRPQLDPAPRHPRRRCELGLGAVALVSLAEAREQAVANRKLARAGGDPLADRRRVQGTPTFAEAATTVIDQKRAGWKTPRRCRRGEAAWNATRSRASAGGRSRRWPAPTCSRSSPPSGTPSRSWPRPSSSGSTPCWSGPSP